jgi:hypothetical protein
MSKKSQTTIFTEKLPDKKDSVLRSLVLVVTILMKQYQNPCRRV